MASPYVVYFSDSDGSVPDTHGGRCDKITLLDERSKWSMTSLYCRKPGKASITWIFGDGSGKRYYYCDKHLDDKLRQVFPNGIVTVRKKGREIDWELNKLIAVRKNVLDNIIKHK